jgi:hypothetical protein
MKGFFIILTEIVLYISILSALVSALIYSRLNHSNRYFAVYLVLGAVIELFAVSFSESGKNNLIFFHLNAIIEFGILTLFFDILFKEKEGKSIKWLLLPGIVLIVFNSLVIQKLDTYPLRS